MTLGQAQEERAQGLGSGAAHGARHVAIIMDGNGRWAKKRLMPRALGHKRGVDTVRNVARAAREMGLEALTLYAFSTENWKRPEDEISDLMGLLRAFLKSELADLVANGTRLKIIGEWQALAPDIVAMITDALAQTAHNTETTLAIALNYGSQQEIARAAARAAANGPITVDSIAAELDTADMPPLDLLIRTSGEIRLSNFLLWQAAYAEMCFVDVLWPDFTAAHLGSALEDFAHRERRFGGR